MLLAPFHPLITEWFDSNVGTPTEVQQQAWPVIQSGTDVLIAAPTGSGKTFADFLSCIDHLFKQALARELDDHTQVLYVSPLQAKALVRKLSFSPRPTTLTGWRTQRSVGGWERLPERLLLQNSLNADAPIANASHRAMWLQQL